MSAPGENAEQERLGFAIRILRHRRAVSQEQLGFDCDLHRNYIGAIERGEINPTFRTCCSSPPASGCGSPRSC
jgi:DNA-binding XRE family transcriptional regulator